MHMFAKRAVIGLLVLIASTVVSTSAQDSPKGSTKEQQVPIVTQWVLDAAGPTQRSSITSVYMVVCPKTNKKGTAFLTKTGIMVTDNHVVAGCESDDLWAQSSMAERIIFSKVVADADRDLALLKPSKHIEGGLPLGDDQPLKPGEPVTTWGYPLIYNGPAPLLSVGYLAGFEAVHQGNKIVKHLVVNGAFNPGNSGGPLLLSGKDTVVGVVVWKMRLLAPYTQMLIDSMSNVTGGINSGVEMTLADGTKKNLFQSQVNALVLQEFYNTVQVMIGEATSVSELKQFIKEKESELLR